MAEGTPDALKDKRPLGAVSLFPAYMKRPFVSVLSIGILWSTLIGFY